MCAPLARFRRAPVDGVLKGNDKAHATSKDAIVLVHLRLICEIVCAYVASILTDVPDVGLHQTHLENCKEEQRRVQAFATCALSAGQRSK